MWRFFSYSPVNVICRAFSPTSGKRSAENLTSPVPAGGQGEGRMPILFEGLFVPDPDQNVSRNRAETLRGGATAVPENRLAKLITFTRLFRFAAWI